MKKSASSLLVLMVVVLLAGCFGPRSGGSVSVKDEIQALMSRYAALMQDRDVAGLADLYSYPVTVIDEYDDTSIIENREQAITGFTLAFAFISEVHSSEIIVDQVTSTGDAATAKMVSRITATVFGIRQEAITEMELRYVRTSGGKWLIKEERTLSSTVNYL